MNTWFWTTALFWALYSSLTIYGLLRFPVYTIADKIRSCLLVLAIPLYGAYLVNRHMGHRIDEAEKLDLAYELPWWASIGIHSLAARSDEDDS